jgi:hypothetical protein
MNFGRTMPHDDKIRIKPYFGRTMPHDDKIRIKPYFGCTMPHDDKIRIKPYFGRTMPHDKIRIKPYFGRAMSYGRNSCFVSMDRKRSRFSLHNYWPVGPSTVGKMTASNFKYRAKMCISINICSNKLLF